MNEVKRIQMHRRLAKFFIRALKAIWEFNEEYILSPLVPVICFSVIFHVVGALFPPIEQNCALDAKARPLNQSHEERLLP